MVENKSFIESLILKGIKECGNDFWFDNTDDALRFWGDTLNIEDFLDDVGYDLVWVNSQAQPEYDSRDVKIFEGEITNKFGDWFIRKIVDDNNQIIVMYASID